MHRNWQEKSGDFLSEKEEKKPHRMYNSHTSFQLHSYFLCFLATSYSWSDFSGSVYVFMCVKGVWESRVGLEILHPSEWGCFKTHKKTRCPLKELVDKRLFPHMSASHLKKMPLTSPACVKRQSTSVLCIFPWKMISIQIFQGLIVVTGESRQ